MQGFELFNWAKIHFQEQISCYQARNIVFSFEQGYIFGFLEYDPGFLRPQAVLSPQVTSDF